MSRTWNYDFEQLAVGDLTGQDSWRVVPTSGTSAQIRVEEYHGYDGTHALSFRDDHGGGNFATWPFDGSQSAPLPMDSAHGGTLTLQLDVIKIHKNTSIGFGFDSDYDGVMKESELGISICIGNSYDFLYNTIGIKHSGVATSLSSPLLGSGWLRIWLTIDVAANSDAGAFTMQTKSLTGRDSHWTPHGTAVSMQLDPTKTDARNPYTWNALQVRLFGNKTEVPGLDNIYVNYEFVTTTSSTMVATTAVTTSTTTFGTTFVPSSLDCTFEIDMCAWVNAGHRLWERHSGPTSSQDTGPHSAHRGHYYLYVEATSNVPGYTFFLDSPRIHGTQASGSYVLVFYYHMYGIDMGTLDVQNTYDSNPSMSSAFSTFWSRSDNQQQWQLALVTIPPFTTMLRLLATTGASSRSDMAIDDISFHYIPLGMTMTLTTTTLTTTTLTTTTLTTTTLTTTTLTTTTLTTTTLTTTTTTLMDCITASSGSGCKTCKPTEERSVNNHCATCNAGHYINGTACLVLPLAWSNTTTSRASSTSPATTTSTSNDTNAVASSTTVTAGTTTSTVTAATMTSTNAGNLTATTVITTILRRAQTLNGQLLMKVTNARQFVEEPYVTDIFRNAIAVLADIPASWVHNVTVKLKAERILFVEHVDHRAARELSNLPDVVVDFTVVVPDDNPAELVVSVVLSRFDAASVADATKAISDQIKVQSLASAYNLSVSWKYMLVSASGHSSSSANGHKKQGTTIWLLFVLPLSTVVLIACMFYLCIFKLRLSKGRVESYCKKIRTHGILQLRRLDKQAFANVAGPFGSCDYLMLLNAPFFISEEQGKNIRKMARAMTNYCHDSPVFITFGTGKRSQDAVGCGPEMFFAAAISKMLFDNGVGCFSELMLPKGASREVVCAQIRAESSPCRLLMVLLTKSLYQCDDSLQEIFAAQDRGIDVFPLRFERELPSTDEQWPQASRDNLDHLLMVTKVQGKFGHLNSIPSPPFTVVEQPSVLNDILIDLKIKLGIRTCDDEPCPELVGKSTTTSPPTVPNGAQCNLQASHQLANIANSLPWPSARSSQQLQHLASSDSDARTIGDLSTASEDSLFKDLCMSPHSLDFAEQRSCAFGAKSTTFCIQESECILFDAGFGSEQMAQAQSEPGPETRAVNARKPRRGRRKVAGECREGIVARDCAVVRITSNRARARQQRRPRMQGRLVHAGTVETKSVSVSPKLGALPEEKQVVSEGREDEPLRTYDPSVSLNGKVRRSFADRRQTRKQCTTRPKPMQCEVITSSVAPRRQDEDEDEPQSRKSSPMKAGRSTAMVKKRSTPKANKSMREEASPEHRENEPMVHTASMVQHDAMTHVSSASPSAPSVARRTKRLRSKETVRHGEALPEHHENEPLVRMASMDQHDAMVHTTSGSPNAPSAARRTKRLRSKEAARRTPISPSEGSARVKIHQTD